MLGLMCEPPLDAFQLLGQFTDEPRVRDCMDRCTLYDGAYHSSIELQRAAGLATSNTCARLKNKKYKRCEWHSRAWPVTHTCNFIPNINNDWVVQWKDLKTSHVCFSIVTLDCMMTWVAMESYGRCVCIVTMRKDLPSVVCFNVIVQMSNRKVRLVHL